MALTTTWCSGFEHGELTLLDTVTGAPTFNTSAQRTGARCLEVSPANAALHARHNITAAAQVQARAAIRFSVLPGAGTAYAMHLVSTAANLSAQVRYNATGTKLEALIQGGTAVSGPVIVANDWHVIELQVNYSSAVTYTLDWWVDGVAQTQATRSVASATTALAFRFGTINTNETYTAQVDDAICGTWTVAGETWGDGRVYAFSPDSDGTHTSTGTNIVKGTSGTPVGAAITSSTTDAWQWVDELPITNAELINQQTIAASEYVEVNFADSPAPAPPRAVTVAYGWYAASTAAATVSFRIFDSVGATEDNIATPAAGVAALTFVQKHYDVRPAALGVWTIAAFNGLRFRFGFSTDATPDMYWGGAVVEAEWSADRLPYFNPMPPLIAQ